MLVRFVVGNYLSFKDRTVFSMHAGKFSRHPEHVITECGHKILKGGFIFGANASGKSNFARAIGFAKNAVKQGLEKIDTADKYFRLDPAYKNMPGVFQFDIAAGGHLYSYGFAISWRDCEILEEWLIRLDDGREIFSRKKSRNGRIIFHNDLRLEDGPQKDRFKVYAEDIKNKKKRYTLFLTDILQRIVDEPEYAPFLDVGGWFYRLNVIFPDSQYFGLVNTIDKKRPFRDYMLRCLDHFDTGIKSVISRECLFDETLKDMPERRKEQIKAQLIKILKEEANTSLLVPVEGMLSEVKYRNGTLYAGKLLTNHGTKGELFEFRDESDGTQRLFHLIPIFWNVGQNNVVIVDEIDRSLHTKLTIEFIRRFYEISSQKNSQSQLVATIHDCNVLDLDLLRQDEIWFVDRGVDQASQLYSLSKFKERFDKKINKEYILGRYGAIPILSALNNLDPDNGQVSDAG